MLKNKQICLISYYTWFGKGCTSLCVRFSLFVCIIKQKTLSLYTKSQQTILLVVIKFLLTMKYVISFILILTLYNVTLFANEKINLSHFSVTSGLPSNEVFCGVYDDLGFLWFGTRNGLSRYDGYSFKNVYLSKLLSDSNVSNSIKLMKKDNDGLFWLITENDDIYVFDPQVQSLKNIPIEVYLKGSINDILITRNNDVYIGTGQGIFKFSKSLNCFMFIKKMAVKSLFEDSNNKIWIGTWNAGVFIFDRQSYETHKYRNIDSKYGVTGFAEDRNGHIWISTWDGNFIYCLLEPDKLESDKINLSPSKGPDSVAPDAVVHGLLFDDSHNSVWVYTANGIVIIDLSGEKEKFTNFGSGELDGAEVMFMLKDVTGAIWGGVEGGGLSCFTYRNDLYTHIVPDVIKDQVVTALYEDIDSLIWIGSRKNVLQIWDRKSNILKSYKEVPVLNNISPKSNSVLSIVNDKKTGNLYLATRYNGLYVVERDNNKITSLEKIQAGAMRTERISDLKISSDNRLWIGTIKGVYYAEIKGDSVNVCENLDINRAINYDYIVSVFCDEDGVWISTKSRGVIFYGCNSEIKYYNVENGKLNINSPSCFYKDSSDRLWMGTHGGGLRYYDEETDSFVILDFIESFSYDYIYSINEDKFNNLWVTTGRGLFRMDLGKSNKIVWYNRKEDLQNIQFVNGVSLLTSDGQLYFGGYSGLDCYKRSENNDMDEYVSPVYIVDVSLMNMPLDSIGDTAGNVFDYLPPYTEKLDLKYYQNNLTFKFSCLSGINSSANMYAYRMLGVDNGWTYVDSNNRNISYNALKKGNYRFEVKASNANGVWSEIRHIDIVVNPAPWFTVWAYLLYVLLLFVIAYLVIRTIKKRVRLQHALEIERLEHKKSDEVNQVKLRFFTNVSHELFTPISVLQCSIDKLMLDNNSDKDTLYIMRSNLKRLHRLLQQILEFRKVENGKLKLKVSQNDIVLFSRRLCEENFYPLVEAKHISLHFEAKPDSISAYFDIDKLDKILYNLLSNALKYNYTHGVISISLSEEVEIDRRYAVIKIENTGDGIPESRLPYIFQRFYEGDYRKFKTHGTGIGLSLTKELVNMHNGVISVNSVPGEVTVFTVKLPIDRDAYTEDQIDNSEMDSDNVRECIENSDNRFAGSHLLLVEDDEDLLTVMSKFLSVSFVVHMAKNGVEAMNILKECNDIDLIITDYVMPEMNGVDLCKFVRNDKEINHLPIIMLTAKTQVEYQLEGYNSGIDVYISKPVEMAVLIAQVKTFLNNRKLVSEKFRQQDIVDVQNLGLNVIDQEFIDKAVQIVQENMDNSEFSTDEFCEKMNMSQSTLYRKLKAFTGMSANEFIRNVRIKKACEILKSKRKSIAEVAYMVGFNDPKYFGVIFRKEIGMSPTKYIESLN